MQECIVFDKESKLYQKCLSLKLKTPDFKRDDPCSVKKCKGKFHHTLLHRNDTYTFEKQKPFSPDAAVSTSEVDGNNVMCFFASSNE